MNEVLTPPLKWAGGKRALAPTIKQLFDKYPGRRLVEPFVGGMSIALGLNPANALLGDINPCLINFYRHLQQGLIINQKFINDKNYYYSSRKEFNSTDDPLIKAVLFYYLNRTCFNGLCRFNNSGEFNVPFGKYKTINYRYDFTEYVEVLQRWEFTNKDFSDLIINQDDFIYCDPPYDTEFTKYSKQDFKWEEQVRLVEWLSDFNNPIVISNQATNRVIDLYEKNEYSIEFVTTVRKISCKGDRPKTTEVLAYRNII
jgi:DNA adenine methylase